MTTPTPESVKALADGLTKAQRALLTSDNPWSYKGYRPGVRLEELGLLLRRDVGLGSVVEHTPLGLAVREYLGASHA